METGKEYALTLVGSGISTSLTISGIVTEGSALERRLQHLPRRKSQLTGAECRAIYRL